MKRQVLMVKPRDTIAHARQILEEHRINQLPVVVNGRLVGIITDRDLRDAFPSVFDAAGFSGESRRPSRDPENVLVEEVMTQKVVMIGPEETMTAAAQLMRRERVGALPVVEAGHLVGILARSDVLEAFVALEHAEGTQPAAGGSGPEGAGSRRRGRR
jgi:acetoin utilization protein AcuB